MSASRLRRLALAVALVVLPSLAAQAQAPATAAAPDGAAVYQQACKGCHGGGIGGFFSGAPKSGSEAMKARLTKAGSVDALVATTARGVGKMPAQGGPKGRSDAELRAAIETMLPK